MLCCPTARGMTPRGPCSCLEIQELQYPMSPEGLSLLKFCAVWQPTGLAPLMCSLDEACATELLVSPWLLNLSAVRVGAWTAEGEGRCVHACRPESKQDRLLQQVYKRNAGNCMFAHALSKDSIYGAIDDSSIGGSLDGRNDASGSLWLVDKLSEAAYDLHACQHEAAISPAVNEQPHFSFPTASPLMSLAAQKRKSATQVRPIRQYSRVAVTARQVRTISPHMSSIFCRTYPQTCVKTASNVEPELLPVAPEHSFVATEASMYKLVAMRQHGSGSTEFVSIYNGYTRYQLGVKTVDTDLGIFVSSSVRGALDSAFSLTCTCAQRPAAGSSSCRRIRPWLQTRSGAGVFGHHAYCTGRRTILMLGLHLFFCFLVCGLWPFVQGVGLKSRAASLRYQCRQIHANYCPFCCLLNSNFVSSFSPDVFGRLSARSNR
eukprot:354411-Chlamydomonas_euryale.AAC.10